MEKALGMFTDFSSISNNWTWLSLILNIYTKLKYLDSVRTTTITVLNDVSYEEDNEK
jgi:hypothetical protein